MCVPSRKRRTLPGVLLAALLCGCATRPKLAPDTALICSHVESYEEPVAIVYRYAVVYKVDGRYVPYDEDPVYLKAGVHRIGIKKGAMSGARSEYRV